MIRLASSAPPLWRTPSSVQLGADGRARIDDVAPWQERLLDALVEGVPDAMLASLAHDHGAPAEVVAGFIDAIRPALSPGDSPSPPVRLDLPPDLAFAERQILVSGFAQAGLTVIDNADESAQPTVIVIAHRLVAPHRAAALLAADTVHVPITLSGDQITIGPTVVPGRTACLACLHAHQRDADADWPMVAAQLLGRGPVPTAPGLLLEAAVLTAHALHSPPSLVTRSVTVSARGADRVWQSHRPHPSCLCRQSAPER